MTQHGCDVRFVPKADIRGHPQERCANTFGRRNLCHQEAVVAAFQVLILSHYRYRLISFRNRVCDHSTLPFQQPYVADLKVLRVVHDLQQFPGFTSLPAFSSFFREPALLRDKACLPSAIRVLARASNSSISVVV